MARTGRIVREIDIEERPQRRPEIEIVSVPERPSERAARRRREQMIPCPEWPKPGAPVRKPEKVPAGGE